MKKILHITSQYPGKTGSGIYLNELIREGKKKGYIQGLVAALPRKMHITLDISEKNFYPLVFNSKKIPFPIVGMSDVMPYESTKYSEMTVEMLYQWKRGFQEIIEKAIEEFKPNIIISHHLWILTSLVKKITPDIKVLSICHGTDIRQFENCPQYRQFVLSGCGQVDLVLALSHEQKNIIHNLYSIPMDRIIVLGGGYNDDIFYPLKKKTIDDSIRLIYAGKLSYAKGVLSLINAYNNLKVHVDKIELVIIGLGTGEEERIIRRAGKESKLKIKFLGEVSQKILGELFRQSHIFILPSFYEGLSLVTIEALASGLMVVATAQPGLIDILGEDINNSGIIEYVDLPKMDGLDTPIKEELPLYENRLRVGIEKQIKRLKEGYILDKDIHNSIKRLSWNNIFEAIEKCF